VQYGVPPAGFQQMIPENGPAPRLVEGDHYGIVAGLYEARNFTPEKCTISSLPPQYVIHGSFVIRHGRFALGVARFRLEDPEGGIFAYSGESIDVDTIMVEEVAPLSAGGIRARLASQRELPGASAQPVVNRAFRVLWLVRAKEIQAWSNSKVQYGVPPPGFAQIIPANTPAPKLLEGHNYWISAGAYGARDFNAETVTVTPGVYPIQQVFTLRHGRFHVSPAKEK
jgi:hypothetical protein